MPPTQAPDQMRVEELVSALRERAPDDAYRLLAEESPALIAEVLLRASPASAVDILWAAPADWRERLLAATTSEYREQWTRGHAYPAGTVGRIMEPAFAVFAPELKVRDAIDRLREMVRHAFVAYGWVVDAEGRLVGVLVFRELLFADADARLEQVMVPRPFALRADSSVGDAMRAVLPRHYPAYPICDDGGRLVGVVRGQTLFEQHAFELTAQPGTMVGVEKEERMSTPWTRSLRLRHPWLHLNLLTAFIAAAVVAVFQETIDRLVVLAVFLPVLAGQSGNTGCQALAVSLRGMTLGELTPGRSRQVVTKEAILGLANGMLIGFTAAVGMFVFARTEADPRAFSLALIVLLAMIGSCTVSGVVGAVVPMALKRLGADPATASSIFLTTATDVVSMSLFLGLATVLIA